MILVFSGLGLAILVYRLGLRPAKKATAPLAAWPRVSIIVPARDEQKNLPALLPSLKVLDYPNFEIVVVDDSSADRTAEVAQSFGVLVVSAGPKPEGWVGKSWACARGANEASGELLLFTDADTIHSPSSLKTATALLRNQDAGLLSAPPFHLAPTRWEKVIGLFQLFPLILTAYRHSPKPNRKYSIGQYLLFDREVYERIGGHTALASSLTEDIDLGQAVLEANERFVVHPAADLYSVRMFESFDGFTKGWTRLLRLGMGKSNVQSVVELLLVLHLFVGPNSGWLALLPLAGAAFLLYRQRHFGSFSAWGAIFFPVSIVLFTALSLLAVFARLLNRPIEWRSRSYDSPRSDRSLSA